MLKSPLSLKATVTRRPSDKPVDQLERQRQAEQYEAVTAASTGTEPVQSPDPDKTRQAEQDAATVIESEKLGKALKREAHALQLQFLSAHLSRNITVFTINGTRLTGRLRQFDQYCLLLEGPAPMLIFKHAITTIAPASAAPGKQRQNESGAAHGASDQARQGVF